MTARLVPEGVLVEDAREASTIYNKGAFGTPRAGNTVLLSLEEALFLAGEGRLRVQGPDGAPMPPAALAAEGARRERGFEVLFLVHRDLRARGVIAKRGSGERYVVYPRGGWPGKDAAAATVLVLSERSPLAPASLLDEAEEAAREDRRLLAAVADEEGDVTYYHVRAYDPRGRAVEAPPAGAPVAAEALADRVLAPALPATLRDAGYGREVGAGVQLPFVEALDLARRGWLRVEGGEDALRAAARSLAPDFDLRETVYRDLRARGLLVRTGFKFGTHFRAYKSAADGEHAPYLVHALAASATEEAPKVAGFVRLAHAVRKTLLFALVDGGVRYVAFVRTRP